MNAKANAELVLSVVSDETAIGRASIQAAEDVLTLEAELAVQERVINAARRYCEMRPGTEDDWIGAKRELRAALAAFGGETN